MQTSGIQNQFEKEPGYEPQEEPILYSTSKVIFLRKLYLLITLHYFFVYLLVIGITYWSSLQKILAANFWFFVFVIIVIIIIELAVLVLRNRIGHPPINYAIYATFTLLLAIFFGYLCIFNYTSEVFFVITCSFLISLGLLIYGNLSKIDLTIQGSSLWIMATILLVGYWFFLFEQQLADTTIILLVVFVFIWFIHVVYDTTTPVSGIRDYTLLDPVSGTILVYSDVYLLFLQLADLIRDSFTKEKH